MVRKYSPISLDRMTLLVAVLIAIAGSAGPAIIVGLLVGGETVEPLAATVALLVGTLSLCVAFAHRAASPRQAFRRGLLVVALEAFVIPIAAHLVGAARGFLITGGSLSAGGVSGIGIGSDNFSAYASIVALIFGAPGFVLYFVMGSSEKA